MMIGKLVLLAAIAAVAAAGRSPHADKVESLMKSPMGSRFSSDIYEDSLLDVPGLIEKYGYPVEVHHVVTEDGYVLEAHRIPHGKNNNNQPGNRPVIFLMHGLLSSSADYVVLGPGNALAYLLAEAGYDVWIGNARGNFYSRRHLTRNPDSDTSFWLFSWEQIGLYDLPAFIDYILELTGESKLHYVGHSQGGTVFLVLNSLKPEYNDKFISFQGFAPASYFTHNDNELFNTLAQYERVIETIALAFGIGEILNNEQAQELVESRLCEGHSIYDPFCIETITSNSAGLSNVNTTMLPLVLAHAPAGASVRQVAHFGQVINRDAFARYYFNVVNNLIVYGRVTPPEFDLSKITARCYLYYGLSDQEVNYRDLLKLSQNLKNVVETYGLQRDTFNHFDFIWGAEVKTELYDKVFSNIKDAERRLISGES